MVSNFTWEQAVEWLRQQPGQEALVRACYFDDPLIEAVKRFADSSEWQAVRAFLPKSGGRALDLGAGRGISSYALARDGWQVIALEPNPSPLVGAAAIYGLAKLSDLPIHVVEQYAEALPFADSTFDLVYGRQVLHHARDLYSLCREMARVLKSGGRFIATREHVISDPQDLDVFLNNHPLHRLHGAENAYLLDEYVSAISQSGLNIFEILGPFDSVINYFPMTYDQWRATCSRPLARVVGHRIARLLTSERHFVGRWLLGRLSARLSNRISTPGRMYSFIAKTSQ